MRLSNRNGVCGCAGYVTVTEGKQMKTLILGVIFSLGLMSVALADTVLLKNGFSVPCKSCTFKDGKAIIIHEGGKVVVPSSMVAAVRS